MRTPEEQLVDASLDMGKALLLAGGEVTRVEDTITRILHAYGMHKVGVFTITSLIEVTARTPDGDEIVKARRIKVPTVVLQMPATVPMIPGGSLYYTMLYVFSGDMLNAKLYFLSTIRAIFGMAIGFAVVSVLLRTLAEKRTHATHGA